VTLEKRSISSHMLHHSGKESATLVHTRHDPFTRRMVIEWRRRDAGCVLIAICAILPLASL
jgi:hypothetical protein